MLTEVGDQRFGLRAQRGVHHFDAGRAQPLRAAAVAFDGVRTADDHTLQASGDDRLTAGPSATVMVARLERDVEGGPLRAHPELAQRGNLGVVLPCLGVMAARQDLAITHDDRAHVRVWTRTPALSDFQGKPHHRNVERFAHEGSFNKFESAFMNS